MPEPLEARAPLRPALALAGAAPAVARIGAIVISENPDLAMASVAARRGGREAVAAALSARTGLALPGPGGQARAKDRGGDWAAFWTGPDQWMLTAPFATTEGIAADLKAALGAAASVTEQTDGWVRFEVTGERLTAMFERLCGLDLAAMGAGSAGRTQIEHLGTFVLCQEPGAHYSVLTLRSAARSMLHALTVAARSLG